MIVPYLVYFYIIVRAKSNTGIYGYDTVMIEYMYD